MPAAAIERYVRGALARREGREIERHLVRCVACQAAVAAAGDARADTVRWRGHRFLAAPASAPPIPAHPAHPTSARLRGVLRGLGAATDAFGAALLEELLAASEHRRRALLAGDPRFASLPLAERLARACRAAWLDDPGAAVELARLGIAVASRLDGEHYGARPVDEARALAWSQLGNSYRVAAASVASLRDAVAEAGVLPGTPGEPESEPEPEAEPGDGDPYPPPRVAVSHVGEPARNAGGDPAEGAPFAAALAALEETLDLSLAGGMAFEAALVTLDLAAAHLRLEGPAAARELLVAAPALLASAGLADAGLAPLRALAAAQEGELELASLAAAASELCRARNDPAARFGEGGER